MPVGQTHVGAAPEEHGDRGRGCVGGGAGLPGPFYEHSPYREDSPQNWF